MRRGEVEREGNILYEPKENGASGDKQTKNMN